MKKLNLRLFRLVKGHIGQFVAVAAVVAVGLLIYTAMGMATKNLETSVDNYYETNEFADIYIEVSRIPESAIDDILKIDRVENAEGRIVQDVPLEMDNKSERVRVRLISMPDTGPTINKLYTIDGKNRISSDQDIILIQLFAEARGYRPETKIKPHILGRTYELEVQGVVTTPEYIYLMENEQALLPDKKNFGVGFVSQDFAQRVFGFNRSFNQVLVKAEPGTNLDLLKDTLEKSLKKYGIRRIYTRETQLSARIVQEEIRGNKSTSQVVPTIFLIVAAVIIVVMVNRMVRNDRMVIGVLKAMGYSGQQIMRHYTLFALMVGVVGAIPGLWLGTMLANTIASMWVEFYNIPTLVGRVYPAYYGGALGLACLFCIGAGLWGAWPVLHIQPAQAMAPEAPKVAKRIMLERVSWFWKRVPFTWKIAIRNLFRSKKRFVVVALGIAVTYSVTLMPLYMMGSFTDIFIKYYTEFQTMDYTLTFGQPIGEQGIRDLAGAKGITTYEPIIDFPFEVRNGWHYKVVNVVGLKEDTSFYRLKDAKGNAIKPPKSGIVISESLAKLLDAKTGDLLTFKSFIPGRKDKTFKVVGLVEQALGINVYMELGQMQDTLIEPGLVTGAVLNGDDRVKEELKDWKNILTVQSRQDLMKIYQEFMQLTLASISIMVIFSFVLGFAIIYNATMMVIHERRMEFSSLRVMGFGKNEIFMLILKENLVISVLGLAMGLPMGWRMIEIVSVFFSSELYTMKAIFDPKAFISTALITILFVIMAQGAAYERIHNLDFIEALKNRIT